MDLSPALQKQIAQLGARYGATKIVLFGSRARGDNHPRSDIDLAIYGMPERQQASFYFAVEEELQTLLKFDLVWGQPSPQRHRPCHLRDARKAAGFLLLCGRGRAANAVKI